MEALEEHSAFSGVR
jgi:hypothetical protein